MEKDIERKLGLMLASGQMRSLVRTAIKDEISDERIDSRISTLITDIEGSIKNSLDQAVKSIQDRTTVTQITLKDVTYEVDPLKTHERTSEVLMYLQLFKQAMIVGPTGSGKSTLAKQVADIMNLRYATFSCNEEASKTELIGFNDLAGYNYPTFLDFYENGGVMLIDEYDAMSPGMAIVLNAAFDRSGMLSVPTRKGNTTAKKHDDFYCILAGNTWGNASMDYSGRDIQDTAFLDRFKSMDYSGRDIQDTAFLDRFKMCRVHIDYDYELEKTLTSASWMGMMTAVRNQIKKKMGVNEVISTRTVVDCYTLFQNGLNTFKIMKTLTSHWEAKEQEVFLNNVKQPCKDYENGFKEQEITV
jgi:energy-coupling factor transporter ATP-binding protein EcfA2